MVMVVSYVQTPAGPTGGDGGEIVNTAADVGEVGVTGIVVRGGRERVGEGGTAVAETAYRVAEIVAVGVNVGLIVAEGFGVIVSVLDGRGDGRTAVTVGLMIIVIVAMGVAVGRRRA
jgi:hypothetical protein